MHDRMIPLLRNSNIYVYAKLMHCRAAAVMHAADERFNARSQVTFSFTSTPVLIVLISPMTRISCQRYVMIPKQHFTACCSWRSSSIIKSKHHCKCRYVNRSLLVRLFPELVPGCCITMSMNQLMMIISLSFHKLIVPKVDYRPIS